MKRTPLKKLGKKGLAWEKCRRELKARFLKAGITTCEMCGADNYLGFAHHKKRRNLGPGELSVVALLCNRHHDEIEILPEAQMSFIILDIIANRRNPV